MRNYKMPTRRNSEAGEVVNNSRSTLEQLLNLYLKSELSDVTLVVGYQLYHVHKLILSMCSDVFKTMLTDFKWLEAFKQQVVLSEDPHCSAVFGDFVRYMYTGSIHLTNSSVLPILTLADKYNVCDLSKTCLNFMCVNCDGDVDDMFVVSWLRYATLCSYKSLENVCVQYIKWNFQKVLESTDFLSMKYDTLTGFLECSDLVVLDEYSLFLGLEKWLNNQKLFSNYTTGEFEQLVKSIMGYIQIALLKEAQCEEILQNGDLFNLLLDSVEYSSCCSCKLKLLQLQYPSKYKHVRTRTFADHHHQQSLSYGSCVLRNYLCEDWSTQLTVKGFSCFQRHKSLASFFSTPASSLTSDDISCWDWQVELYPRGVFLPRGILIGLQENFEVEEKEYETIRLAVVAKSFHRNRHVEISVLAVARGTEDGSEFVKNIVTKRCIFDSECCLFNIDNIVPFEELQGSQSVYLTSDDRDTFKIIIIIKPIEKMFEYKHKKFNYAKS